MDPRWRLRWSALLGEAVTRPGMLLAAYSRFHGYSIGNQVAALSQCFARDIEPGPIASYERWKSLGRSVKAGERALWLCMSQTSMKPRDPDDPDSELITRRHFTWKPRWFVLSQTEGKSYQPEPIPEWSKEKALRTLEIEEVPFTELDGNVQGYAKGRTVAVSPLAEVPPKTLFHELGHVLLGHTGEGETKEGRDLPKNLRETEAESVALICSDALGLPGGEYCRGYIQHWYGLGNQIPEPSAMRIFGEGDAILKAGRVQIS